MTVGASLIWMLTACGGDRGDGVTYPLGKATAVTVSLSSRDPMPSAGGTQVVTAIVTDGNQTVISSPSVSWRSSAPSVATVTGSGSSATVTAVDDGAAVITAASGGVEGTVTVTVRRQIEVLEVSAPDSALLPGSTTQMTVIGRDGQGRAVGNLTGVSFTTTNPFSLMVSPNGLVTALFSTRRPFSGFILASLTRDGVTFTDGKRIDVTDPAPPAVDFSALMQPQNVRPVPVNAASEGIVFFTRNGARVDYQIFWSLLLGPPLGVRMHGPAGDDAAAEVLVNLPIGGQANTNGTARGSFSAIDITPLRGNPAISLDSLVALMKARLVYVDVSTPFFRTGEIRGSTVQRQ